MTPKKEFEKELLRREKETGEGHKHKKREEKELTDHANQ